MTSECASALRPVLTIALLLADPFRQHMKQSRCRTLPVRRVVIDEATQCGCYRVVVDGTEDPLFAVHRIGFPERTRLPQRGFTGRNPMREVGHARPLLLLDRRQRFQAMYDHVEQGA